MGIPLDLCRPTIDSGPDVEARVRVRTAMEECTKILTEETDRERDKLLGITGGRFTDLFVKAHMVVADLDMLADDLYVAAFATEEPDVALIHLAETISKFANEVAISSVSNRAKFFK